MTATQDEPRFVNLQGGNVCVFDERRNHVTVSPFAARGSDDDPACVVKGEHFRQFVSAKGPLYPFPDSPQPDQKLATPTAGTPGNPIASATEDAPALGPDPSVQAAKDMAAAEAIRSAAALSELGFTQDYLMRHAENVGPILDAALALKEMGLDKDEVIASVHKKFAQEGEFPEGYFDQFDDDANEEEDSEVEEEVEIEDEFEIDDSDMMEDEVDSPEIEFKRRKRLGRKTS